MTRLRTFLTTDSYDRDKVLTGAAATVGVVLVVVLKVWLTGAL